MEMVPPPGILAVATVRRPKSFLFLVVNVKVYKSAFSAYFKALKCGLPIARKGGGS